MTRSNRSDTPVVLLKDAALSLGERQLWSGLNLEVRPGEFIAVLGPNGSGKTSLLRVLLGLTPLSGGEARVNGQPPRRGSHLIGYVPQQRAFDPDLPIRGWDLVRLGLDGHQYGLSWGDTDGTKRVNEVIEAVGASEYAGVPIGLLSGGEQQRLRIAQALLGDPRVLLCDEPLLSLDLAHQQEVSALIDERRWAANMAVLFVTHEINPILPLVDRVLYLVDGRWAIGTPQEVLTSARLSELYGAPVEVLRVHGRVIVVGTGDEAAMGAGEHHK
jgi:zinc/manganese transport system ATP-binding protein